MPEVKIPTPVKEKSSLVSRIFKTLKNPEELIKNGIKTIFRFDKADIYYKPVEYSDPIQVKRLLKEKNLFDEDVLKILDVVNEISSTAESISKKLKDKEIETVKPKLEALTFRRLKSDEIINPKIIKKRLNAVKDIIGEEKVKEFETKLDELKITEAHKNLQKELRWYKGEEIPLEEYAERTQAMMEDEVKKLFQRRENLTLENFKEFLKEKINRTREVKAQIEKGEGGSIKKEYDIPEEEINNLIDYLNTYDYVYETEDGREFLDINKLLSKGVDDTNLAPEIVDTYIKDFLFETLNFKPDLFLKDIRIIQSMSKDFYEENKAEFKKAFNVFTSEVKQLYMDAATDIIKDIKGFKNRMRKIKNLKEELNKRIEELNKNKSLMTEIMEARAQVIEMLDKKISELPSLERERLIQQKEDLEKELAQYQEQINKLEKEKTFVEVELNKISPAVIKSGEYSDIFLQTYTVLDELGFHPLEKDYTQRFYSLASDLYRVKLKTQAYEQLFQELTKTKAIYPKTVKKEITERVKKKIKNIQETLRDAEADSLDIIQLEHLLNSVEEDLALLHNYTVRYINRFSNVKADVGLRKKIATYIKSPVEHFAELSEIFNTMSIPVARKINDKILFIWQNLPRFDLQIKNFYLELEEYIKKHDIDLDKIRSVIENIKDNSLDKPEDLTNEEYIVMQNIIIANRLLMKAQFLLDKFDVQNTEQVSEFNKTLSNLRFSESIYRDDVDIFGEFGILNDFSSDIMLDAGASYWHIVPNDHQRVELVKEFQRKFGISQEEAEQMIQDYTSITAKRADQMVDIDKELVGKIRSLKGAYGLRKSAEEELKDFFLAFQYTVPKKLLYKNQYALEHLFKSDTLLITKFKEGEGKYVNKAIAYYLKTNRQLIEGYFSREGFDRSSFVGKIFYELLRANVSAALGSLRMVGANLFQPFSNSLLFKPLSSVLKGYGETIKQTFRIPSKKYYKDVLENLSKRGMNPEEAQIISEYFSRYQSQSFIKPFLEGLENIDLDSKSKLEKLYDVLSKPFQWSDFFTRLVSLDASYRFASDRLEKFIKDFESTLEIKIKEYEMGIDNLKTETIDLGVEIDEYKAFVLIEDLVQDFGYRFQKELTKLLNNELQIKQFNIADRNRIQNIVDNLTNDFYTLLQDYLEGYVKYNPESKYPLNELTIGTLMDTIQKRLNLLKQEYVHSSVNNEIYLYHLASKPALFTLANKIPMLKYTLIFTSWPLYYMGLITRSLEMASEGNIKPLRNLLMISAAWIVATKTIASMFDDGSKGRNFFNYLSNRAPILTAFTGITGQMTGQKAGFITPILAVPMLPIFEVFDKANQLLLQDSDAVHWTTQQLEELYKSMPVVKKVGKGWALESGVSFDKLLNIVW